RAQDYFYLFIQGPIAIPFPLQIEGHERDAEGIQLAPGQPDAVDLPAEGFDVDCYPRTTFKVVFQCGQDIHDKLKGWLDLASVLWEYDSSSVFCKLSFGSLHVLDDDSSIRPVAQDGGWMVSWYDLWARAGRKSFDLSTLKNRTSPLSNPTV